MGETEDGASPSTLLVQQLPKVRAISYNIPVAQRNLYPMNGRTSTDLTVLFDC